MRQHIVTFGFLFTCFIANAQTSINEIRAEFYHIETEKQLDLFIEKTKKCSNPEAIAYLASSLMWKAEYAFFPTKKLSFFKKGKKLLEDLINKYPTMIEARYIRALLKSQSPEFLGYRQGFHTDLDFVKKNLKNANLPKEYKVKMTSVLREYKLL